MTKKIDDVSTHSKVIDTILNVTKAGFATFPFTGGIASLITDYIPSAKQKRIEDFMNSVIIDLQNVSKSINANSLKTDLIAFTLEKCLRGVAENPYKEKIEAFRGILVNSLIGNENLAEEKEYFINLVNNLAVIHLKILRFMNNSEDYLRASKIPKQKLQVGFKKLFSIAIPEISIEIIISAFEDLYRQGLINTDSEIFNKTIKGNSLDLLNNSVTSFGKRFIQFCIVPTSRHANTKE